MNLIGALIGGAIGGLIGGALWAAVAYGTGYEIGWIAWGVGGIVGFGVAWGSKGEAGQAGGVMAAVIALASILIAKYVVVEMLVNKHLGSQFTIREADIPGVEDKQHWIMHVSDQLIDEQAKAGKSVRWPAGVDPEEASEEKDYPKEIWSDAKRRWEAMSHDDQVAYRDAAAAATVEQANAALSQVRSRVTSEGFFQSFGVLDLVFGFLAVATAFRIGSSEMAPVKK